MRLFVASYGIWLAFIWPIVFLVIGILVQYFQLIIPNGNHIWPHYIEMQYVAALRVSGESDYLYAKYYIFYIILLLSLAYFPVRFVTAVLDFHEELAVLNRRVADFRRKKSKIIRSEVSMAVFLILFPIAGFWAVFSQRDFAMPGLMGEIFRQSQNTYLCLEIITLSLCLYGIVEGVVSVAVMMRFPK